jgi:hypothetical protein
MASDFTISRPYLQPGLALGRLGVLSDPENLQRLCSRQGLCERCLLSKFGVRILMAFAKWHVHEEQPSLF